MKNQRKNFHELLSAVVNKEQKPKNLGHYYFRNFTKAMHYAIDQELIDLFNREVGLNGWTTSRASFLAALHKEFEKRRFDFSAIGDSESLSFKHHIKLDDTKKIWVI